MQNDIQSGGTLLCAYCPHDGEDHHESVSFGETDEQRIFRAGMCKVNGCECIQFKPLDA